MNDIDVDIGDGKTTPYFNFVALNTKSPADIISTLGEQKVDLTHAAIGISTEAGELLDAVKKYVIYDKPLDRENVIEELGDLEFYMQQMRNRLGVSRKEIIEANVTKLRKRYPQWYTDRDAQLRADKS